VHARRRACAAVIWSPVRDEVLLGQRHGLAVHGAREVSARSMTRAWASEAAPSRLHCGELDQRRRPLLGRHEGRAERTRGEESVGGLT
jgi:hypothetical protein